MEEQDNTVAQSQPISAPKRAAREAEEPAAWVLVPREPTEEMVLAGMVAPRSPATSAATNTYDRHASLSADIYRAMLAAAPTSDSKHSEGGEGLTSSQSQPCSETGPNSPSSPQTPFSDGGGEP